jgi:plasmid stability protein
MKSITIHNLEDPLDTLIRQKANNDGTSLNKTVKNLLAQALQVPSQTEEERKKDFLEFFGVWSETDEAEFCTRTRELNIIHQEDWQ